MLSLFHIKPDYVLVAYTNKTEIRIMQRIKKNFTTILLFLVFFVGLCLLLYPSFADYWNSLHQSRMIAGYVDQISNVNTEDYKELWDNAVNYNKTLLSRSNRYNLTEEQQDLYEELLDVSGTGVMGYIEIPTIKCTLPVYHGTDHSVLQIAIGHIDWTSLPTGGLSTHCVLSGHRGLPSAKLFTDLDRLVEGDVFILRILNEVLTYEVDHIRIVDPDDVEFLHIEEGEDLCTLVTCTPYGINSHRLLVTGHRIDNLPETRAIHLTSEALTVEPMVVAPLVAIPVIILLLMLLLIPPRPHYNRDQHYDLLIAGELPERTADKQDKNKSNNH